MKRLVVDLTVLLLGGPLGACASTPWVPIPTHLERITYRPEGFPFCGRCETTEVTIAEDGRIWVTTGFWAGDYEDWREQRRAINSSPDTYARFRDALAPYRPAIERIPSASGEFCSGEFIADGGGGAIVTWSDATGSVQRIFEAGCQDDAPMVRAVRAARAALPVRE